MQPSENMKPRAELHQSAPIAMARARISRVWIPCLLPMLMPQDEISPRMSGLIAGLYENWIALDERIDTIASEIEKISEKEANCERLMSVPGIGPLISTAVVAAIGTARHSSAGAISEHGLVSCHASTAQVADLSWVASPSEAASISEHCSSRPQTSS
jgi:transposase